MRAQIFAYEGVLGAITDPENGLFLNDPKQPGQLGVVIPVEEIDITSEAISLLKAAKREGGSFSSIMLTRHSANDMTSKASIGLLGGLGKAVFTGDDLMIGRDCDTSILDMCTVKEDILPLDFVDFVKNNFK